MRRRRNKGYRKSKERFSMDTVTLDGSRVKDNVQCKEAEPKKSHDAIMRKVRRHQSKISY